MIKKYFSLNGLYILIGILFIELVFNLVLKYRALNDQVIINSSAGKVSLDEINTFLLFYKSNAALFICISLLQPLIEILLIAICINVGTLLLKINISFKSIAGVVTKAFLIFSISRIVFIIILLYTKVNRIEELTSFSSFSVADWINTTSIPSWALYPLQIVNIFQLIFVLLLTYGYNLLVIRGYKAWLATVLVTYGLGLIILITIISFLTSM